MEVLYNKIKLSEMNFNAYKICRICNILVKNADHVIHCEDCGVCVKSKIFILLNFILII
jgi:hypothetical protein